MSSLRTISPEVVSPGVDSNVMSEFYCVAPFRQVFVDSSGVSPCCRLPRQSTTLQDWENNEFLKKIQQQTTQGQWPQECASCKQDEQIHSTSLRIQSNADYDQQYTDTKIDFIDYRLNNLCNFRCRSCGPEFSHLIAKETHDNPEILSRFFPIDQKKYVNVDPHNHEWVIDNLHQLKRIMFTGGEPTVMPQVKTILQHVLEHQHDDLLIMITSNGSFQDEFWYNLTRKLPNLHWTISIDATGAAASIVRDGSDWQQIEYNARWLAKNAGSFMINSVISNISLFQLWPLLQFVHTLKQQSNGRNGCDHRFHIVNNGHQAVDNLDPALRASAIDYLAVCSQQPWDQSVQFMLNGVKEQIVNSTFDQRRWKRSQEYNFELDRLRGQDHTRLFLAQYPD